jgi:hypothetical protein
VFFGGMPKGEHSVMTDIGDTIWLLQQMRERGIPFPEAKVHFARPDHPALPENVAKARQQGDTNTPAASLADLGISDEAISNFKLPG